MEEEKKEEEVSQDNSEVKEEKSEESPKKSEEAKEEKHEEKKEEKQPEKFLKESDESNRMIMGVLSYLSILVIIPLLVSRDDAFVKYHIKQGLVLLALYIIWWIILSFVWILGIISWLVSLAFLVLIVFGIVHVVNKEKKPLPVVGGFAKYFTF